MQRELDRQIHNLQLRGYPVSLDPSWEAAVADLGPATPSHIPFILVTRMRAADVITQSTLAGKTKPGKLDRNYKVGEPANFAPVIDLPSTDTYLLFDIERGEEFCDITPSSAMSTIATRGRTPLTIDEGLALITHHPQVLEKNKCFMLGGSRCGDRRVPALWISEGAPKLGWCWEGNPHTWLGTASAGRRH